MFPSLNKMPITTPEYTTTPVPQFISKSFYDFLRGHSPTRSNKGEWLHEQKIYKPASANYPTDRLTFHQASHSQLPWLKLIPTMTPRLTQWKHFRLQPFSTKKDPWSPGLVQWLSWRTTNSHAALQYVHNLLHLFNNAQRDEIMPSLQPQPT